MNCPRLYVIRFDAVIVAEKAAAAQAAANADDGDGGDGSVGSATFMRSGGSAGGSMAWDSDASSSSSSSSSSSGSDSDDGGGGGSGGSAAGGPDERRRGPGNLGKQRLVGLCVSILLTLAYHHPPSLVALRTLRVRWHTRFQEVLSISFEHARADNRAEKN